MTTRAHTLTVRSVETIRVEFVAWGEDPVRVTEVDQVTATDGRTTLTYRTDVGIRRCGDQVTIGIDTPEGS